MLKELKGYKCPGCGAMLDPSESEKAKGVIICRYCNTHLELETVNEENTGGPGPADGTGTARRKVRIAAVAAGGVILMGIAAGIVTTRTMTTPQSGHGFFTRSTVNITEEGQSVYPISCKGDDSIAIRDQAFTKNENILLATGGCRAVIDNSTMVSNADAIRTSSSGTIAIDNADISGDTSALWADGNPLQRDFLV